MPILTALSFSGGQQSSCLLWMVCRGDIQKPKNFIILNADPGMENTDTYAYVEMMEKECNKNGIPFLRTSRSLYRELLELKQTGKTRFDTPPFYTKNRETGSCGRLKQQCTGAYKIAGMRRITRIWMEENLGIGRKSKRLGDEILCEWIGFAADEWHRIKDDGEYKRKFAYIEYPLVSLNKTKADCQNYLKLHKLPVPPRSVCNACFANSVLVFEDMALNRPNDFEMACKVDDAIRDLSQIGIKDECYVSSTLIPLRRLKEMNFKLPPKIVEQDTETCHNGRCFV